MPEPIRPQASPRATANAGARPGAALSSQRHDLLVVDDDPLALQLAVTALQGREFNILTAGDVQSAMEMVTSRRPPLVLLDMVMPDVKGLELLERILGIDPNIDVILVTGHYSPESAVEAIQKGAYDYLTKPLPIQRLRDKLDKWIDDADARLQTVELDGQLLHASQFEGIVGRSPLMLDVFSKIRRIAPHFQTALIRGATGTGKELVAKALHTLSPYGSGPFVVCNCAAIAESIFESELFGHVKGSFTSATQDKKGLVDAAVGGTLFLDEIAEIPLNVQAKLLRLLQNREVQRVGSPYPRQVDVRFVAATNRDLKSYVADRKLREDLYYRLAMVEIRLPSLSERREDLPLLQRHFLEMFALRFEKPAFQLSRRVQALMASYAWQGNVRELENVLGYCCMMAEREIIDYRDLPEALQAVVIGEPEENDADDLSLATVERRHIEKVLRLTGGNRARAAEILGISRTTIYRLLNGSQAAAAPVDSDGSVPSH